MRSDRRRLYGEEGTARFCGQLPRLPATAFSGLANGRMPAIYANGVFVSHQVTARKIICAEDFIACHQSPRHSFA
jgi:hypothetical protein